jgi:hypothetical protein
MLPFANVVNLLANEFTSLRRRGLPLALVLARALERFTFWHCRLRVIEFSARLRYRSRGNSLYASHAGSCVIRLTSGQERWGISSR